MRIVRKLLNDSIPHNSLYERNGFWYIYLPKFLCATLASGPEPRKLFVRFRVGAD